MKRSGCCPKCGCQRVLRARPLDRGEGNRSWTLALATEGNPGALFFKDRRKAELEAFVCHDCGFVEWYVNRPEDLHQPG